jgi:hypothetical protein
MSPRRLLLAALASLLLPAPAALAETSPASSSSSALLDWPATEASHRPWTRWWWLGSAVDAPNLSRELEEFAAAGIGGVEICPIYGTKGAENRFLDFLSPAWTEALRHTLEEAKRLGLGVDLTTGTGWPFGGAGVRPPHASIRLDLKRHNTRPNQVFVLDLSNTAVEALEAVAADGRTLDLRPELANGLLRWTPPEAGWTVVALTTRSPIQDVKRAAPGGAGPVLDPYSPEALRPYLSRFDEAFHALGELRPRAQFHDSFEYYGAGWTRGFFEHFVQARGYDLREEIAALAGIGEPDRIARVRSDYRETLGERHEAYLRAWHDWAKTTGGITRNQAHGSPGNLLDHYAVSEIPETEIFRAVEDRQIPMMRLAASSARLKGDTLVSCEAFTWLDEHFQVTPAELKQAADFLFLAGVNHLFFHGIPYSPEDAAWPGWLFYASTHMGRHGGLWRDLPAFNAYLTRVQSILQRGRADSDVLVFFPYHDLIADSADGLPLFTLHNQDKWLHTTPFHATCMELESLGASWDAVSAARLRDASVTPEGNIMLGGQAHRCLILPGLRHIPVETLETIAALARAGAHIVVRHNWPREAPGLHQAAEKRQRISSLIAGLEALPNVRSSADSPLGPLLTEAGVRQEIMLPHRIGHSRRTHPGGHHYFLVNRSEQTWSGWLPLAVPCRSAVLLDPWSAASGTPLEVRQAEGRATVPLRLEPGQSIILRTFTDQEIPGPYQSLLPEPSPLLTLDGPWALEFLEGGPALPHLDQPVSTGCWTRLVAEGVKAFSGTARYRTRIQVPAHPAGSLHLDLGRVAHTARVRINGQALGTLWAPPYRVAIPPELASGDLLLEIEVTNLAANRIADLDRRGVDWKIFHEINFVNLEYQPFDASAWPPSESGLLGPVRLLLQPPH